VTEETTERGLKRLARSTVDQVVARSDNLLWRIAEHVPGLHRLVARRERSLARQQCAVMLNIARALQHQDPTLAGEALYQVAVVKRLGCSEAKAREIVRLADQSFAQWPEERDVNLRDVVNYVIVHQIMSAHSKALGTLIDMEEIVAAAIPSGL
jgi:hypothetical protein